MNAINTQTAAKIPELRFRNLFEADPLATLLFGGWLGEHWTEFQSVFERLGRAGAVAQPLSHAADQNRPELRTEGRGADTVSTIVYHPDAEALEDLAYATGLVQRRNDLDFLVRHSNRRNLVSVGSGYYFAQTEIGIMCQVCMTDGVGAILERYAANDVARSVLPRLGHPDRKHRMRGAMFLSERQGGSDIGTITTSAEPAGDLWRLTGEKWFCSNVDAEAILVLARMPDGTSGTRGLGLFLVLRDDPPGNGETLRITALKHKLGVGSTPSGDVKLQGTVAHLIGGVREGFKRMTEMINLTRLYNAAASVAGMRRAILETLAYGSQRRAFGSRLWELPLWRASMADLVAEHLGAVALTFGAVRSMDLADNGDPAAGKAVRMLIPLAKAMTGKLAVFGVGECMEAMGGTGYLEDGILPRLLRDVSVLPIWEGTTNILTLDVARALVRERAHEALFDRLNRAIAALPASAPGAEEMRRSMSIRLEEDTQLLASAALAAPEDAQRAMRE